jgi:catechol-2,3-dioxygenase
MSSALGMQDEKMASFKFEIFISVQYLRVLYRYFANILYLNNLEKNQAEVVLMKNHEFQTMISKQEEEPQNPNEASKIGTNSRFRQEQKIYDTLAQY